MDSTKTTCFQLFDMVVEADDISDEQKARICKKLGETDKVSFFKISYSQAACFTFIFWLVNYLVWHNL